jgi:thymidylate synthase
MIDLKEKMMNNVNDIREYFIDELKDERFTTDKTGAKTIELLGASFIADEPAIFGKPVQEYINAELAWYESGSTNINDIHGEDKVPPAAWQYAADKYGNINSNYGHLVFSKKYHNQFQNAFDELWSNPDSRRAQMVYNRPSIWVEFDEGGKSDFICTNAQTFYIRDGILHMVSQMRSNDVVFGYKNDYAWAQYLMDKFVSQWNQQCKLQGNKHFTIEKGMLTWQVMNLHVYSRHFDLVKL